VLCRRVFHFRLVERWQHPSTGLGGTNGGMSSRDVARGKFLCFVNERSVNIYLHLGSRPCRVLRLSYSSKWHLLDNRRGLHHRGSFCAGPLNSIAPGCPYCEQSSVRYQTKDHVAKPFSGAKEVDALHLNLANIGNTMCSIVSCPRIRVVLKLCTGRHFIFQLNGTTVGLESRTESL